MKILFYFHMIELFNRLTLKNPVSVRMEKNENDGGGVNNPKAELISSSQMNFERFR